MRSDDKGEGTKPMKQRTALLIAAAVAAAILASSSGRADEATDAVGAFVAGTTVHGVVDAGGQPTSVDGRPGKFKEYRDIPDNAVINQVQIRGENDEHDYFAEFRAEDAIQDDQRYQLRMGKYGRYELEVEWDQIPHLLTTTGRTLFTDKGDGEFQLADELRQILATDPARLPGLLDAAHSTRLATRRDTGRLRFRYTPLPEWEVRLAYGVERDRGHHPFPTANFTGLTAPGDAPNPFLASIVELPSPVDFLTHTVDASIEYHRRDWFVRLGEYSSFFENRITTLAWDNPFQSTDSLGAGSRGRLTLAPDNQAHTISASGGATLPLRTRLTGTVAYGWMLQDDTFQPATINAAVPVAPLPRASIDGTIQTLLANVLLSAHPHEAVTVNARYHLYDLDNRSRSLMFANYVIADAVGGVPRRSLPYAYSRQTAGADVIVRPLSAASLKVSYQWERWHREHREVRNSDEHRVGPSVDLTPVKGVLLRAGYTHAERDPQEYDALAARDSASPAFFNPLLRKYDEAKRVRDRATTLATITPHQRVSLTGTFAVAADDFPQSSFGLLDDNNLSYSFELAGAPVERLRVYGDYTREEHRFTQRVGLGPLGKSDFRGRGHDTVDTWGTGVQATLLPEKVDVDLNYSFSFGVGRLRSGSSTEGVEATDFPNVDTKLHQLSAICSYKVTKQLTARLGYAFERYETNDFASQSLQPFMPSSDGPKGSIYPPSLFLGARNPDGDYNAHVVTVALRYQF